MIGHLYSGVWLINKDVYVSAGGRRWLEEDATHGVSNN